MTTEIDVILAVAEAVWQDEPTEAELDLARQIMHAYRERIIDAMTPPTGGPDDPFWQGAQWAYGQVRDLLNPPAEEQA